MSMCRAVSCIVGRGCLLWPVHSLGRTLLAFALIHFVLRGQTCLLLQVSLDFLIFYYSPHDEKDTVGIIVVQLLSRIWLCDPMDCSTSGFPVLYHLPELAQLHVHWVGDVTQPSCPLSSPFPPVFNLFQHQGLFKWVSSLLQVARVLELQLQHQSLQWIFKTDFL